MLDWNEREKATLSQQLRYSIAGSQETVKLRLQGFLDETQADEMIINTHVYDHQARLRSIGLTADIFQDGREGECIE